MTGVQTCALPISWITLHQQGALTGSLGVAKLSAEQLRIRELERELAITREEREILKTR